jgi:hypothetical protein
LFLKISAQELLNQLKSMKNHLNSSSYNFDSLEFVLNGLAMKKQLKTNFKSIQSVNAFFEANKFRGIF